MIGRKMAEGQIEHVRGMPLCHEPQNYQHVWRGMLVESELAGDSFNAGLIGRNFRNSGALA